MLIFNYAYLTIELLLILFRNINNIHFKYSFQIFILKIIISNSFAADLSLHRSILILDIGRERYLGYWLVKVSPLQKKLNEETDGDIHTGIDNYARNSRVIMRNRTRFGSKFAAALAVTSDRRIGWTNRLTGRKKNNREVRRSRSRACSSSFQWK